VLLKYDLNDAKQSYLGGRFVEHQSQMEVVQTQCDPIHDNNSAGFGSAFYRGCLGMYTSTVDVSS
jgi:hypothetical protein